ncbi:MAG: hypothetical protein AB8B99_11015 [Phormidesmis sp.]
MAGWLRTCGLRLCGRSVRFAAIAFVLCVAVVLTFTLPTVTLPTAAWAADLQSSQASEQPAILVGPKEDAPIPLYLRPAANQPNVGYGMSGAVVTVLEQVASFLPEADQSAAWNHIRLEDAPFTEGWVQGRFLLMQQEAD